MGLIGTINFLVQGDPAEASQTVNIGNELFELDGMDSRNGREGSGG